MASLAWLLIPVVAAVAAGVWGSWAGRRRNVTPDTAGVEGYERFRAAMERPRPHVTFEDEGTGEKTFRTAKSAERPEQEGRAPALSRPEGPARAAD
ncbi:hypothetical protein [Streptomyces sp. ODS28]|uniref:hypothetical protein n=1 Tax=Streptomyces sp. ODS28 TaxID=3136688 RepID=UPI0031EF1BF0